MTFECCNMLIWRHFSVNTFTECVQGIKIIANPNSWIRRNWLYQKSSASMLWLSSFASAVVCCFVWTRPVTSWWRRGGGEEFSEGPNFLHCVQNVWNIFLGGLKPPLVTGLVRTNDYMLSCLCRKQQRFAFSAPRLSKRQFLVDENKNRKRCLRVLLALSGGISCDRSWSSETAHMSPWASEGGCRTLSFAHMTWKLLACRKIGSYVTIKDESDAWNLSPDQCCSDLTFIAHNETVPTFTAENVQVK